MKKLILSTAIVPLFSIAAYAADLPNTKEAPAYAPPPPALSWAGFYAGLNAGYEFGDDPVNTTSTNTFIGLGAGGPALAAAITGLSNFSAPANNHRFIGGGQIGYNWQFSTLWVAGLETDIQGLAGSQGSSTIASTSAITGFPVNALDQTASVSRGVDYLGTVRGRVGILAIPNLLLFGTGGLAYGGVEASTRITQTLTGPSAVSPPTWSGAGSVSNTRVGWTVGGGLEWMFLPNWSAKVEYLYYDLGSVTYGLGPLVSNNGARFTVNTLQSSARFNGDIARVGVNYHF